MDLSQVMQLSSTTGSSGVQGMSGGGHRHHHKSISDQVSKMGTAIDNAVSAGKMTSDQATALKKELADITQTMQSAQASSSASATSTSATSTGSSGQTGTTNPLSQLSDADRKKVFSELQDVRKQLHAAFNPQGASATSGTSGSSDVVSNLFSQIDTDQNGSISKDEFTQFLAQVGANSLGYNAQGNMSSTSGSSFSIFG